MYDEVANHEVDEILSINKGLIKPLYWEEKKGNYSPQILIYFSAMDIDNGTILEGVTIRASWIPSPLPDVKPKYGFSIFLGNHRVFALDFDWIGNHKNKIGRGLPFYKESFRGPHRHLWVEGNYGYAEPLNDNIINLDMESHWKLFCYESKITRNNKFASPEFEFESGQGKLL